MVLRALLGGLEPIRLPTVALEHGCQCPAFSTCWRHDECPAVLSNGCRGRSPLAEGCVQQLSVGSDTGQTIREQS